MEMKTLINQMNNTSDITFDDDEIDITRFIEDNKYNLLRKYLSKRNIKTTNDLKKLSSIDYNSLKMDIPNITGVGEDKTSLFIRKLDIIRNNKHVIEKDNFHNISGNVKVANLGKIKISRNWFIEINYIDYGNHNEYLDIRQVRSDNTRGKGISIKKNNILDFKKMIDGINLDFLSTSYEDNND